jgi:thioredoxin reductase (NADPH)
MVADHRQAELGALVDSIMRRFGADYRVIGAPSANAALDEIARTRVDGDEIALVIADQGMPDVPGREFLLRAHAVAPDAQRALLAGWGDKHASSEILQGCAMGQLDNYILEPWAPAELHLYPVIGDFLASWARTHGPRLELVQVVSEDPSRRGHEVRDLIERSGIPHGTYVADSDAGRALIADAGIDPARLPAVILFDGRVLHDPSNAELADLLGTTPLDDGPIDIAIVGAGPSGLAAAVTAASEGLRTVVIERTAIGGQAGASSLIRNFLGFPRGISGNELAQRAYQQAWLFGARYVLARHAITLRADGDARIITLDDGSELRARVVLIATGADYRRSGVPRIDRFEGAGVQYAVGADIAIALRGQDVVVYGGGNSAGQAVVFLAKTARRVVHVVRGKTLSHNMSRYLIDEIGRCKNVDLRLDTEVVDADGTRGLEQVTLQQGDHTEVVATRALFLMIGAHPHTEWLEGIVERDRSGFILTGAAVSPEHGHDALLLETSLPGVFAAGDVRAGSIKRLASAVGEATAAIQAVHQYLAV